MEKDDQFKVDVYKGLIDESCIKTMKNEVRGLIFFLIGFYVVTNAVFNSEINVIYILGIKMSMYYLVPFFISLCCILVLLNSIFKLYWRVVFEFGKNSQSLLLRILVGQDIRLKEFEIITNPNKLGFKNKGHLEYFKRVYYQYIGVKVGKRIYLIPYVDGKKDDVVNILLESGGVLVEP